MATKAAREGQLRAEEIRLLRAETEQLKQQNAELKMKTQVEVEALQEQLRVRKEKQYQLLEKLQAQEEAKRQAEDQVTGMEEQLRGLHARNVELETQLQIEARSRQNLEETNKELQMENSNMMTSNRDLQIKIEKSEKERLRMEAEARDSGEQLREMAEKVFQLLERLKLAELGKTKAMEGLKKKEQDMVALQKKNARLIKESTEESRTRVKAELDVKVLQDQVRSLKKHNQVLTQTSKEETRDKVRAREECEQLQEKQRTIESRLAFLLNKVQSDDEARVIQIEDRRKLEAQLLTLNEKCDELQQKLTETGESNRIITQAMRLKQEELNEVSMKYEALYKETEIREANEVDEVETDMIGAKPGAPDDIDNVRLNEGRGRFYVEAKTLGGGSLLLLRGRKPLYREWLEKHSTNEFLKRSQKSNRFRDMIVEKLAQVYGLLMVETEEKDLLGGEIKSRDQQIDHMQRKMQFVQDALATEEDAKRRMLLRYIHAAKEAAVASSGGTGGVLQLPDSNITDEEVHALAAMLRNNVTIDELNLRGNNITDDGARALAAVLAGRSGLRLVDLRGNKIGKGAIRVIAEALERSDRVRHVYVHAGGKIEALGTGQFSGSSATNSQTRGGLNQTSMSEKDRGDEPDNEARSMVTVETVCVVDVRDNNPPTSNNPLDSIASLSSELMSPGKLSMDPGSVMSSYAYAPSSMLESSGAPPKSATGSKRYDSDKKKEKLLKLKKVNTSDDVMQNDTDRKRNKAKMREEKLMSVREAAWQGRAGGMDGSVETEKSSVIKIRKKGAQRGDLPPMGLDAEGSMFEDSPKKSRGSSAPSLQRPQVDENDRNQKARVIQAAMAKVGVKKKRSSAAVKMLEKSPFAEPFHKTSK
eukprot:CAMPEP_0182425694 /NCGR_PEP_ID=MMETSP1167-20130531/12170_1 /TAXON_ID=2988 /ORGANISM="Mallomonas Sp, Strain CCMP3275" /LENGTH=874 /DNA_ID=CAMNT_0024606617 /DNA_START=90 /DNA_END=2714 /DNA_ORIENTATION=+